MRNRIGGENLRDFSSLVACTSAELEANPSQRIRGAPQHSEGFDTKDRVVVAVWSGG